MNDCWWIIKDYLIEDNQISLDDNKILLEDNEIGLDIYPHIHVVQTQLLGHKCVD